MKTKTIPVVCKQCGVKYQFPLHDVGNDERLIRCPYCETLKAVIVPPFWKIKI